MIKILCCRTKQKGMYRVANPWSFRNDLPAFHAEGDWCRPLLIAEKGYEPRLSYRGNMVIDFAMAKIVIKQRQLILSPCQDSEEEYILLIAICGEYGGHFCSPQEVRAKVLRRWDGTSCTPEAHMIVQLSDPMGYVTIRSSRGEYGDHLVQVFSWNGGHQSMSEDDFGNWLTKWAAAVPA